MNNPMNRAKKTSVLRARCDEHLKRGLSAIAAQHGVDEADIVRIACHHYLQHARFAISAPGLLTLR